MKKFILVLLLVFITGGFCLGGCANQNPAVGLKLQLTNVAKIEWIDNFSNDQKLEYLNDLTETEYLTENKDTYFQNAKIDIVYFLDNNIVELRTSNSTTSTTYYYLTSPNGKTFRIYKDENFMTTYYDYWYGQDIFVVKDNDNTYWSQIAYISYTDPVTGWSEKVANVMFKLDIIK